MSWIISTIITYQLTIWASLDHSLGDGLFFALMQDIPVCFLGLISWLRPCLALMFSPHLCLINNPAFQVWLRVLPVPLLIFCLCFFSLFDYACLLTGASCPSKPALCGNACNVTLSAGFLIPHLSLSDLKISLPDCLCSPVCFLFMDLLLFQCCICLSLVNLATYLNVPVLLSTLSICCLPGVFVINESYQLLFLSPFCPPTPISQAYFITFFTKITPQHIK